MKLEVLLSVMNVKKEDLDKMNITTKCTVINQCGKNSFEKYKNFNIYSYNEIGVSNSRNRALEHATEDILLFCDDDVVYNDGYEKAIIDEFKNNKKADVIIFNMYNPYRKKRIIKKNKRLHLYNSLNYATYNIACRKDSIKNIKFNPLFGPGSKYNNGSDTLFIKDFFYNNLKVYSSSLFLGKIVKNNSTWFKGYNELYFFNKGALFTAINKRIRHLLFFQFLVRHHATLVNINFYKAYRLMNNGANDYLQLRCKSENY